MSTFLKRAVLGSVLLVVAAGVALTMLYRHSYVTTTSMYPTIPPGSMMFISPEHRYQVGDVIEFRANGMTWAHRLVGFGPRGTLITKGDNPQSTRDIFLHPLTRADVIGKVVAAPRWIGFPELIANHPSYGLSWLRSELGLGGKLAVTAVVGGLSSLLLLGRRPQRGGDPAPPVAEIDLRESAHGTPGSPVNTAGTPPVAV